MSISFEEFFSGMNAFKSSKQRTRKLFYFFLKISAQWSSGHSVHFTAYRSRFNEKKPASSPVVLLGRTLNGISRKRDRVGKSAVHGDNDREFELHINFIVLSLRMTLTAILVVLFQVFGRNAVYQQYS